MMRDPWHGLIVPDAIGDAIRTLQYLRRSTVKNTLTEAQLHSAEAKFSTHLTTLERLADAVHDRLLVRPGEPVDNLDLLVMRLENLLELLSGMVANIELYEDLPFGTRLLKRWDVKPEPHSSDPMGNQG
jgi:hypothetical protein